jgi:signal transduction histidine kinase/ActR/RegA family two-component response regulator
MRSLLNRRPPLNLRSRILLFVAACIVVFCVLAAALGHFILLPAADEADADVALQNLRRFEARLELRLSQVSQAGLDWANWDDTGAYLAARTRRFERENFDAHSFADSNLDLVALWDAQDRFVIGRMRPEASLGPVGLPAALVADLTNVPRVFQRVLKGETRGAIRTSLGVLLLSAQPISNSAGTEPVRGTVVVGNFLRGARLAEVQAHEPFVVELIPADPPPPRPGPVVASNGAHAVYAASDVLLVGRSALADLRGGAAAIIDLRAPRNLRIQHARGTQVVLGALVATSVVLLAVVGVMVDVLFLRRLFRLQKEVRELRDEEGIARLEATDGTPEFQTLGRNIAAMARGQRAARLQAEASAHAKSVFLATMSHEIRTPLNGVLGFTSLLRETPLNAEQKEYVTTIEQSGEILLALINDILDLSKLESGRVELERQPVVLADMAAEIGVLFKPRLQSRRVALVIEIADDVPPLVVADALRLRQVLFNLVGNAAKFTSQGEVRLRIERVGDGPEVNREVCDLRFEVADTGIGLTPEQCTRLFQPFSQADTSTTRQFGGTGLGLAISQRLVEAMGGKIGVVSKPGFGARFFFSVRVPVPDEPAAQVDGANDRPVVPMPSFAGRVLVVEDNAVNRRMVLMMLQRLGCTADFVENGREAVAKATLISPGYDVVLMDVVMPEMDGLDATRAIRAHEATDALKPAWIIALTASALAHNRDLCQAAGMNDFLAKPIRLEELITALARAPLRRVP